MTNPEHFPVHIAPMLDWTTRHCRYLFRLLTRHAVLYTEMIHANALIHGPRENLLRFDQSEHTVICQLGGSDPLALAQAAKHVEDAGYDAVNLNVGCPSARVQSGNFGACLMAEPLLVAECVSAMQAAVGIPVTVKTRLGIDEQDSYEFAYRFIDIVSQTGCTEFTLHARKAWLNGLSPKENRDVPPLNYERVHQLKRDFSQLSILINGGLTSWDACLAHKGHCDGVMVGRFAYHEPRELLQVDKLFYGDNSEKMTLAQVVKAYCHYAQRELAQGAKLKGLCNPLLNLCNGMTGARAFRRYLSEHSHGEGNGMEVIAKAFSLVA